MAKRVKCCVCETTLNKNEIGLNKKLIGGTYQEKLLSELSGSSSRRNNG